MSRYRHPLREPLPDWVYALNRRIRAESDRLDELNRLLRDKPSDSVAHAIQSSEKRLAALEAQHPDHVAA